MRAEEIPELRGDSTGNHEVVNWHQLIYSSIEPGDSLLALTCGAMTISTGSEDPIGIRAVLTGAHDGSQRFGSALDDCPYHLFVIGRHPLVESVQIRFAVGEEHITYGHRRIRS